jgi:hypothetical protein
VDSPLSAETQTSIAFEVITVGKMSSFEHFFKKSWKRFKTP